MRTIEFNLNDSPAQLMEQVLRQLEKDTYTTRKPKLHAWQCRLYSHIINHPKAQADELAAKYFDAAAPYQGNPRDPELFRKKMLAGAKAVGFLEDFPGMSG